MHGDNVFDQAFSQYVSFVLLLCFGVRHSITLLLAIYPSVTMETCNISYRTSEFQELCLGKDRCKYGIFLKKSFFSTKAYGVDTQKNPLKETILLNVYNICLGQGLMLKCLVFWAYD